MRRIFLALVIFASIFFAPTWLVIFLSLAIGFFVPYVFYEYIAFGIILDTMQGMYSVGGFALPRFTLFGFVLVYAMTWLKRRMNIHV